MTWLKRLDSWLERKMFQGLWWLAMQVFKACAEEDEAKRRRRAWRRLKKWRQHV